MVDFISNWAKEIIVVLIIVIVFELIIPNGKNKKYIELVMGLFILYAIINPVTGKRLNLASIIGNYNEVTVSSTNTVQNMDIIDKNVENVYKEKLKENIISTLKEKCYEINDVKVEINNEDGENYGNIESIVVNTKKNKRLSDDIKIEKVDIENKSNNKKTEENEKYEEIKNVIYEVYSVSKDKIVIN